MTNLFAFAGFFFHAPIPRFEFMVDEAYFTRRNEVVTFCSNSTIGAYSLLEAIVLGKIFFLQLTYLILLQI